MLNFGTEDILAFEDVFGPSGEVQAVHVTLKDGSHHCYQELHEVCEILALLRDLKNRERPPLPVLSTKPRRWSFSFF